MIWAEGKLGRVFVVRFESGEEIVSTIKSFLVERDLNGGFILALGSFSWVEARDAYFNVSRFTGKIEFMGWGTISKGAEHVIHMHVMLSLKDEKMFFGHLLEGRILYGEAIIGEIGGVKFGRKFDERMQAEVLHPEKIEK